MGEWSRSAHDPKRAIALAASEPLILTGRGANLQERSAAGYGNGRPGNVA
jgi:hypothetical protein